MNGAASDASLPGTAWRSGGRADRAGEGTRLLIEVSDPFRLDFAVWALRRRAHNEVDRFDGHCYRRVLSAAGEPAEVAVYQPAEPGTPSLVAELRGPAGPPGHAAAAAVRPILERMLGLTADLAGFYQVAEGDPELRRWRCGSAGCARRASRPCSRPWSTPSPASSCRSM